MPEVRVISGGSMTYRSITTVGHRLNQTGKLHKTASKLMEQHKNSLTFHAPLTQFSCAQDLVCIRTFIRNFPKMPLKSKILGNDTVESQMFN